MNRKKARSKNHVPSTKGPVLSLDRHQNPLANSLEELQNIKPENLPELRSVDLFCGCGGLSLGLGREGFVPVLGVDIDSTALETWGHLFPGVAANLDLHDPKAIKSLIETLQKIGGVDLIAGGPPCQPFSRAGRALLRKLVKEGRRDAHDVRRDLWESFLEIVTKVRPNVVLMENVPDMALGDDMRILRTMVSELESISYSVATRLLDAPDYGIPQLRQRLFLVAIKDGVSFSWPQQITRRVNLGQAIADLPEGQIGWGSTGDTEKYIDYEPNLNEPYVEKMRQGAEKSRIYDHATRSVRDDDRRIFEQMTSRTLYSEIDKDLQRYRSDIFDDKYKRLDFNKPSRAITAHMAKDGYWYIHPRESRTLTIREAARVQTFPDKIRFAGAPTAALRQIGNAVPPLLGEKLGRSIRKALDENKKSSFSTLELSEILAKWIQKQDPKEMKCPWFREAKTPWQVIQAELVLARADQQLAYWGWKDLRRLEQPRQTLEALSDPNSHIHELLKICPRKAKDKLASAAQWFVEEGTEKLQSSKEMFRSPAVNLVTAQLAESVAADLSDGHVMKTDRHLLRVAARFAGVRVDAIKSGTDGAMELMRLVGGSVKSSEGEQTCRKAQQALVEISRRVCVARDPLCSECPLAEHCRWSKDYSETAAPAA